MPIYIVPVITIIEELFEVEAEDAQDADEKYYNDEIPEQEPKQNIVDSYPTVAYLKDN